MLCQLELTFKHLHGGVGYPTQKINRQVRLTPEPHHAYDRQVKLTHQVPNCQVFLTNAPHYLVSDVMAFLGVSERQVYRWFDDGTLTKRHYPDDDSKNVCVPADEVHELDERRQKARTSNA